MQPQYPTIQPWFCPRCGQHNAMSSSQCGNCHTPHPAYGAGQPFVAQPMMAPAHGVFTCPYCHTQAPPIHESRISTAGWIVFALLLVFTCIFCWIGLLIKEQYTICSYCRTQIR